MTTAENPRAVAGGNNPPEPIDPLIIEGNERVDTANKWLTERTEIADLEMADKAAFFISQVSSTHEALDGQRLQEGRDFKAKQDAKYSAALDLLVRAKDALVKMRRAWLQKEDARIAEENRQAKAEADRLAQVAADAAKRAEEEAKKKGGDPLRAAAAAETAATVATEALERAAAPVAKPVIKGAYTTRAVGLRDYWSATVDDFTEAFKIYKKRPAVILAIKAAVEKEADADAKKFKDKTMAPKGVTFNMEKR